ncbi:hypothetical protein [Bosea beijingensis]
MTNQTLPSRADGTDDRETKADYAWIVAELSDRWRVVECPEGIQWIIQSRRGDGEKARWYNKFYCRSLVGLLLHVDELTRRKGIEVTPAVSQILASLPDWIEAARCRSKERVLMAEAA